MNRKRSFFWIGLALFVFAAFVFWVKVSASAAGAEAAAGAETLKTENGRALFAYAAVAAVSVSCITSSYALARIGTAAMGAMSEKPEIGGRALVFLGMAEGIAIYGLIVAIMLVNKI